MSLLLERLEQGFLLGDAPLAVHAQSAEAPPEALCLSHPQQVQAFHTACIEAGCSVVRTNTLAANAASLQAAGLAHRANEINWTAVQLALAAAKGTQALVAGCVGPISTPQPQEADHILRAQIGALLDGGVSFIVFCNFPDIASLHRALHIKNELHHCPAVCLLTHSATGVESGSLLDLASDGADIIGCEWPETGLPALHTLMPPDVFPAAVIPAGPSPATFAEQILQARDSNYRLAFGGPGTTPTHLARISHKLRRETPREVGWDKAGAESWEGCMRTYCPNRDSSPT